MIHRHWLYSWRNWLWVTEYCSPLRVEQHTVAFGDFSETIEVNSYLCFRFKFWSMLMMICVSRVIYCLGSCYDHHGNLLPRLIVIKVESIVYPWEAEVHMRMIIVYKILWMLYSISFLIFTLKFYFNFPEVIIFLFNFLFVETKLYIFCFGLNPHNFI